MHRIIVYCSLLILVNEIKKKVLDIDSEREVSLRKKSEITEKKRELRMFQKTEENRA